MNTTRLHAPAGPWHPAGPRLPKRLVGSLPKAPIVVVLALVPLMTVIVQAAPQAHINGQACAGSIPEDCNYLDDLLPIFPTPSPVVGTGHVDMTNANGTATGDASVNGYDRTFHIGGYSSINFGGPTALSSMEIVVEDKVTFTGILPAQVVVKWRPINFDGKMSGDGDAYATTFFFKSITGSSPYTYTASASSGTPPASFTSGSLLQIVPTNVPLDFRFEIATFARITGYYQPGTASVDYLNTVSWGGIESVTDLRGNPVDWALSSESGVDWGAMTTVAAVPEPDSWAMIGLALIGFSIKRFGNRSRHNMGPLT